MYQDIVRNRLSILRKRSGVTQEDLAQAMGFKDRQTLSAIELGERGIKPDELLLAASFLKKSINYFTDPLELGDQANFSWRKSTTDAADINKFEDEAGRWIATYRYLSKIKGGTAISLLPKIDLNEKSSPAEAQEAGDEVSRLLELGNVPAANLIATLEEKLQTLILHVDTMPGISGAACQLNSLNVVIINRRETPGRRAFDLGHEFFHLLTWAQMKPDHVENVISIESSKKPKIEQLADSFAAGLLMPTAAILSYVRDCSLPTNDQEWPIWIKSCANYFGVSGQAAKWRLVNLGYLSSKVAKIINNDEIKTPINNQLGIPPRFSRKFLNVLGWGIESGHISVRRVAQILNLNIDDLGDLFTEQGLKAPFEI